ncbi:MAG: hypothetical protein HY225_04085 [Candidatus Vogelbacteria bacterium]|nr:hypothetical protein [Candidatus Vogelbacteria bacterium]
MIDKNGNPSGPVPVPGSIVVYFRAGTPIKDIEDIFKQNGCSFSFNYPINNDLCYHVIVDVGSEDTLVTKFRSMSQVTKSDRLYLQGYL